MVRIIIVEDDVDLREGLEECLGLLGLTVTGVGSALEFFRELALGDYDVAIIDVGLPDETGFDIAAQLSRRHDLGVILLTARGTTMDRIRGFDSGADLYFVKPVDCHELAAAVNSLIRRLGRDGGETAAQAVQDNPAASWLFDRTHWALRAPGGEDIRLTSAEMRLLDALVRVPGETAARHQLLKALEYHEDDSGNRNLDALIRRLRRKIETSVAAAVRSRPCTAGATCSRLQ